MVLSCKNTELQDAKFPVDNAQCCAQFQSAQWGLTAVHPGALARTFYNNSSALTCPAGNTWYEV